MGRGERDAWARLPLAAAAVRVAAFAIPVGLSLGIAVFLTRSLPAATGVAEIGRVLLVVAISVLCVYAFGRVCRRLLPLAALLDISLVFPDAAPRRFRVARHASSPRDLRAQLRRALQTGDVDDARRLYTVMELALALSVHDRATRGHSERVRVFTDLIAQELHVDPAGRARLRWAALLHDIGKLEVPPSILRKPGPPTDEEWAALHRHPEEGAQMIAPLLSWFGEWAPAVEQHHERYDGSGYPRGLRGSQISLGARILAVADCFEVMTGPRSYKRTLSVSAAREELVRVAGSQLDPVVVRAFLSISMGRLWRIVGVGAWFGQIPSLSPLLAGAGGWAPGLVTVTATATMLGVTGFGGGARVHASATDTPPALTALDPAVASGSADASGTSPGGGAVLPGSLLHHRIGTPPAAGVLGSASPGAAGVVAAAPGSAHVAAAQQTSNTGDTGGTEPPDAHKDNDHGFGRDPDDLPKPGRRHSDL